MRLYLVRHAVAFDRDTAEWPDDSQRPLTPAGIKRFRKAAKGLGNYVPDVDVLLSSPFTRAWQTAEILEEHARWPRPIRCEPLATDQSSAVAEFVRNYGGAQTVALVGHEPNLSLLAAYLFGPGVASPFEMKKGGAACLEFPGDAAEGSGRLLWLAPPRLLRALA